MYGPGWHGRREGSRRGAHSRSRVVDAGNETDIRGVVVFVGNMV